MIWGDGQAVAPPSQAEDGGAVMRVVLVDDPVGVAGLRSLLDGEPGVHVVGASWDAGRADDLVRERNADVGVINLSRPGLDVALVLERLQTANPGLEIIALLEERERQRLGWLVSGPVASVVIKRWVGAELVETIRRTRARRPRPAPVAGAGSDLDHTCR